MHQTKVFIQTKARMCDKFDIESLKSGLYNKPSSYYNKSVELTDIEKIDFPCFICLVNSTCNAHCIKVFRFMNYIADHMRTMTADEICVYRRIVPNNVRKKIELMIQTCSRLAHPEL